MLSRVTICVDRLNPPYVVDEYSELRGITIDLVRGAFAARQCEVDFLPAGGPIEQAMLVSAGRADAAADITVTTRRQQWFRFSRPYMVEELQLFMLRHGPLWPGWTHFHGTVGVKADSYVQEYLIRHHHALPLLPVDTTERLLEVLDNGRVQAIVMARVTGAALLAGGDHPDVVARGAPFGPAPLALAALPDRAEVLDEFQAGLAAMPPPPEYAALRTAFSA